MKNRLKKAFWRIVGGLGGPPWRLGLAAGAVVLLAPIPAQAVFYTVCPTGCSSTTIAGALTMAASTDTVVLESNITESVSLNSNIAGIQSSASRAFTWAGTLSTPALTLGTGLSQSVTFTGLVLDSSGGGASTVAFNALGPGVSVTFINCQIQSSPAVNTGPLINATGQAGGGPDSLVLDSCDLVGNAVLSSGLTADLSVTAALRVQNCVFQGFNAPGAVGIALNTASSNAVARLWNNTFYAYSGDAVVMNTRGDLRNNLFAGGPTTPTGDVAWLGNANPADAVTNAFADVTNTAGYGSGNLFGISAGNECVSPSSGDFHLLPGATCVDAGSNLASQGVLVDKQGTPRPQGCCYDIGAYEFVFPPTPTPIATAIGTVAMTPAGTFTPTATQTPSPTPAYTATPAPTPIPCIWVLTGSAVLPAGTYNLCSVTVQSGATLTIQGNVTLNLSGGFYVQSGGTVNGTGLGYAGGGTGGQAGAGPGGGGGAALAGQGGGGGGYGGAGGNDGSNQVSGGGTYGSLTAPIDMGSGGGAGQSGVVVVPGGAGGAALIVNALSGTVQVDGSVLMDGAPGGTSTGSSSGGGGGGAGGSVYLQAQTIAGTGSISASGAQGGSAGTTGDTGVSGGGSGGGGRIDLCASGTDIYAGALHANGISGGAAVSGTGNSSGGLSYGGTVEYCASGTGPTTSTPTRTATRTMTPSITSTDSPLVTDTDSPSATPTNSPAVTATFSPAATLTDSPAPSSTVSPVANTPSSTPTPTRSPTPLVQATNTPVPSATATPMPAPVYSATDSPTPGPTATPVPQAVLSTNLFHPQTQGPLTISALVPHDGHITVRIYDLTGDRIDVAADQDMAAGTWLRATWDGQNRQGQAVASGIYFISVRGGGLQSLLKVVVLR